MCGVVGIFDRKGNAARLEEPLRRATATIAHRGPDDDGFFFKGPVGLGFRRLSILDLSLAGHQPMTSADGHWTVIFNGEIYNFIEMREALQSIGVQFQSTSDTEVLVESLAAFGVRSFERCNGMWAVLAWHEPSQSLYACRDPWGIKPLYVSDNGEWIGFASEIKALRTLGCDLGGADLQAVRRFVDDGELDVATRTMYARVERLQPGVIYRYRDGKPLQMQAYSDGTDRFALPAAPTDVDRENDYIEAFRTAFLQSIQWRLRSDVDIGTCMSGGLDSTAVACAAARFLDAERSGRCRHAFTALIPEFDESPFIQAVLAQTGAEWHVTVAGDGQLIDKSMQFFDTHDEPVHSFSPFAGFLVMGMAAAAGVKVLLNGQGADELLAGYPSSVVPFLRSSTLESGAIAAFRQAQLETNNRQDALDIFARAQAGLITQRLPGSLEALLRSRRLKQRQQLDYFSKSGPIPVLPMPAYASAESLQSSLHDQTSRSPLPLYLRIEDANSSAFSLEVRLPFLDPAVVALARHAPARLLRRGGLNKYLLRRILPGLVPDLVWQRRDKMGFPVPNARWMRGPLMPLVRSTLAPDRLAARGWYDVARISAQVDRLFNQPDTPLEPHLMRLFLLEIWAQRHLDRSPTAGAALRK